MSNGCICCTLREDLLAEVQRLAAEKRFDYLLIESSGISEPLPVAQTFTYQDDRLGIDLGAFATLDTLVTVVDAFNFHEDYASRELLFEKGLTEEADQRTLVNLLIEQIEFANVIVLNKCDLINEEQKGALKALLRKFNAKARIVEAVKGRSRYGKSSTPGCSTSTKPPGPPAGSPNWKRSTPRKRKNTASGRSFTAAVNRSIPNASGNSSRKNGLQACCAPKGSCGLLPVRMWPLTGARRAALMADRAGVWWCTVPENQWGWIVLLKISSAIAGTPCLPIVTTKSSL